MKCADKRKPPRLLNWADRVKSNLNGHITCGNDASHRQEERFLGLQKAQNRQRCFCNDSAFARPLIWRTSAVGVCVFKIREAPKLVFALKCGGMLSAPAVSAFEEKNSGILICC